MPDIIIHKRLFYNPVDFVLRKIGGTWKMPVLWRLKKGSRRYSELLKDIEHISQKMLTQSLKELEADGFISKKIYPVVPPRTEYSLTTRGRKALRVIESIRNFGLELMKQEGIDYSALIKTATKPKKSNT